MAVFYSFHYDNDASRAQQVLQMGTVEGQRILNAQRWEAVKRAGDQAVKNWIAEEMNYKRAVVVLVGSRTASRKWVRYEIEKAWQDKRPLVGIRIHGLTDLNGRRSDRGRNPFATVRLVGGSTLASHVPLHAPAGRHSRAVYASIRANLTRWVDEAVIRR